MSSYQILWYSRQFDTASSLLTQLSNALDELHLTKNIHWTQPPAAPGASSPDLLQIITRKEAIIAMRAFQNELKNFPRRRQTLEGILLASSAMPSQQRIIQSKIDSLTEPLDFDQLIIPQPCQAVSSSGNNLEAAMIVVFPALVYTCLETAGLPDGGQAHY